MSDFERCVASRDYSWAEVSTTRKRVARTEITRSYVETTAQWMSEFGLWLFVRSVSHSLWLDHLRKITPSEL